MLNLDPPPPRTPPPARIAPPRTHALLLTGIRVDDTDFTADDPPTRASVLLRRLITVDYHAATTRSGHPLRPKSVRDFAHKWRGLVRTTRRAIECLF